MEEQKQEQQGQAVGEKITPKGWDFSAFSNVLYSSLGATIILTTVATLLSLIGIILGAINFVGPAAHYPTWILATWFVCSILFALLILLHVIFYMILSGNSEAFIYLLFIAPVSFILLFAGMVGRHFAWISIVEFPLLIAIIIIDVLLKFGVVFTFDGDVKK